MKKCFSCGAEMPDDAKFCGVCGKSMAITNELIQQVLAGDSAAASELYERTCSAVYSKIRAKVPDDDTAQDILQDTYLQAFTNLDQLQEAAAFPGWIGRIAHNRTANWYRDNKNARSVALFSEMEYEEGEGDFSAGLEDEEEFHADYMPEVAMDREETSRLMSEILDTLPEEQRIILVMRYYDEMSLNEIAEELGVNLSTVKTRLTAGKKKVEAKVRELEKQGTKLYSLTPLPFLLYLLRSMENYAPGTILSQSWDSILAELAQSGTAGAGTGAPDGTAGTASGTQAAEASGQSASGAAGGESSTASSAAAGGSGSSTVGNAAGAAGKAAVSAAGRGLITKVIVGVLTVALVGGGATAAFIAARSGGNRTVDSSSVEEVEETDAVQNGDTEESISETDDVQALAYAAYAQIYTDLEAQYGAYTEETYNIYDYEGTIIGMEESVSGVFYTKLIDFTGDGVSDLIAAYGVAPNEGDSYASFGMGIWSWDADTGEAVSIYSCSSWLPWQGGDYADQRLLIAYRDGTPYLGVKEGGAETLIQFLGWNGTEFAVIHTLEGSYNPDDEWMSDVEIYAPYGMGNTSDPDGDYFGPTNAEMETNAKQAITETKAALGLSTSTSSDQTETDAATAKAILEDVRDQYGEVLSGQLSYYDFAGASYTRQEDGGILTTDYLLTEFRFDVDTGYFQLSDEEKKSLVENESFQAAFYDSDGDGIEEMLIRHEGQTISIWKVQDDLQVEFYAVSYNRALKACSDGVILLYERNYSFSSGCDYYFYSFDSLIHETYEELEMYFIAVNDGESVWDYTSYVSIEDQLEWTVISIN